MYENVKLTATFYYYYEEHFKCEEKISKYIKRVGEDKAKKIMQSENGCNIIGDRVRYTIDKINYHTCVCGFKHNDIHFYLNILDKFDKGVMPFEGCLLDQPSKIIEILDRISYMKNDFISRQNKKDNK